MELRRGLGLDEDPTVEIFVEEDTIVLKKVSAGLPVLRGGQKRDPYGGGDISNCRAAIAEQMKQNG